MPVRYDRDLVQTTIMAVQRVEAIKAKREKQFYKNRVLAKKQETEHREAVHDVQKNVDLLKVPAVRRKQTVKVAAGKERKMDVDE